MPESGDSDTVKLPIVSTFALLAGQLSEFLSAIVQIERAPHLFEDLAPQIAQIKSLAQLYVANAQKVEGGHVPAQQQLSSAGVERRAARGTEVPAGDRQRRQSSPIYDYLLAEALRRFASENQKIGQTVLHEIGLAFDQRSKNNTLTSKLNRWKDGKTKAGVCYVAWSNPRDITLTEGGEAFRAEQFNFAKQEGDFGRVEKVISDALLKRTGGAGHEAKRA